MVPYTTFALKRESDPADKKIGIWQWRHDAFTGTRELNGLRVLMAVINNWDLKDVNNAIYQVGPERIYMVSDLGASFGSAGRTWPPARGKDNLESYRKSKFIRRLTADSVDFAVPARPTWKFWVDPPEVIRRIHLEWIGRNVPRADAKWIGQLLARLSPQQLRDAFRAGGYSPEETEQFAKLVRGTDISTYGPVSSAATPELQLIELRIQAAGLQQCLVVAALHDGSVLYHEDHVGPANRGEAVSDHDGRLALHQPVQSLEDQLFRGRVETRAGLVQNQDGAVADHGASDGDALALAAGEGHAPLANHGVVTLRHLLDELMRVGQLGGAENLGAAGFRLAVRDVVPDRAVEQQSLLQHEADLLAHRFLRETADVAAVDAQLLPNPDRRSAESG